MIAVDHRQIYWLPGGHLMQEKQILLCGLLAVVGSDDDLTGPIDLLRGSG
jgi:hypothetical protein